MKVAIVRPYASVLSEKGYNVQEFGLAKGLLKEGINVDVYCAGKGSEIEKIDYKKEHDAKVRIIRMPYKTVLYIQGIFSGLFRLLKNEKYDLLQTQGYQQVTSFLITWFGTQNNIPVVMHEGLYETDYGRMMNLIIKVFNQTLGIYMRKNIIACIAKTDMAKASLIKDGFRNIKKLPIGLDVEKFNNFENISWRKRLGLSEAASILLYVGVIEPRRNLDFTIKIVNELVKKRKPVYLVIVGSGPDEKKCRNLSKDLNLGKHVIFLGRVNQKELPSLYQEADLFLLPSNYEIVGMVLLESLYFGLPVISTRTAGGLDIVNERAGKLIGKLSVEKWAEFILSYLDDPNKYGFREYLNKYPFERSWDKLGQKYAEFYKSVIQNYMLYSNR
ncbi:glycosyltransferase family 4 protein [candidate division KSB1 bacterium]|nr:glycosyltransferase family 4 protein [candidate division KSB1 bacterium]